MKGNGGASVKKMHAKRSKWSSNSVQNLQPDSVEMLVLGKTWKPEVTWTYSELKLRI